MTKLVEVIMPAAQEGTESIVSNWFVSVGEYVAANAPLVELSTDKVMMELPAPVSGVVREIRKAANAEVKPGEVLGVIDTAGEAGVAAPERGGSVPGGAAAPRRDALAMGTSAGAAELSPAVKRLLREHGLDVAEVRGTGQGGRITAADVTRHVAAKPAPGIEPAGGAIPSRRVPHSPMRRMIAQHMSQSVAVAPHVTSVFEADLTAVIHHREAHKDEFAQRGARLTMTAYFVAATVAALRAVPAVNSRWHDDALELFEDLNIGVATALGGEGLIVPVLHKAQELDLFELARRLEDLTLRARENRLESREVQQGTFTISNHGVSGSLMAAPIIINQPQSAILGIGKMERRAVVIDQAGCDTFVARPMCYVTLTIDHRVLDGFQANAFLSAFVESLQGW